MRVPRSLTAVGAGALAALLAGCGSTSGAARSPGLDVPLVAASRAPLTEGGAWWAAGTLHVGADEQQVGALRSFVVADRTVAYVGKDGRLCLTDLESSACSDYEPYGDLVVSPDGRHLAFLEGALGRHDEYDTPQLATTVVDLDTGEILVSSTERMGDPEEDDLGALYPEAWPHVVGFDEAGAVLVSGAQGDPLALPVDGSDPTSVPSDPFDDALPGQVVRDLPGETVAIRRTAGEVSSAPGAPDDSTREGLLSPDGDFVVVSTVSATSDLRVADAPRGTPGPFEGQQEDWWSFGVWAGPHDLLATTLDFDQTTYRVYRCDAATRTCELEQEVPTGDAGVDAVLFPTLTGSDVSFLSSP